MHRLNFSIQINPQTKDTSIKDKTECMHQMCPLCVHNTCNEHYMLIHVHFTIWRILLLTFWSKVIYLNSCVISRYRPWLDICIIQHILVQVNWILMWILPFSISCSRLCWGAVSDKKLSGFCARSFSFSSAIIKSFGLSISKAWIKLTCNSFSSFGSAWSCAFGLSTACVIHY